MATFTVVSFGSLLFGAAFSTVLSPDGRLLFSGPGVGGSLAASDVALLVAGRPYSQNTRRVASGCAFFARLQDGREMLLPGGLHWRRELVVDDVARWGAQNGVTVEDSPLRRPPRLLKSARLWWNLERTESRHLGG